MSIKDEEWLLFDEARHDLAMEAEGTPAPVGEMQRQFPSAYQTARELALSLVGAAVSSALSMQQAKRISEMIHSEHEGLSSIQDVLNMQPVNALTLAFLVSLERKRTGKKAADTRHNRPDGSRENRAKIQAIWASGKYTTKDRCAIEECEGLGMSYDTARKALRTPAPSRCK
jgi:hypothetical protein